ncbi:hypothetical protein ACV566_03145 [Staphylococcus aureus]
MVACLKTAIGLITAFQKH